MPEFNWDLKIKKWVKECATKICVTKIYMVDGNTWEEAQNNFSVLFSLDNRKPDYLSSYCKECDSHKAHGGRIPNGLTFKQMLDKQNNKCYLCQELMRYPEIDHDHITGKIRKILCKGCNIWMAAVDDMDWLHRAIAYRDNHRNRK